MKKNMLISILVAIFGCQVPQENSISELYNDKSGFCISARLPGEWVDYKDVRSFLDEQLIFQCVKGTKDTSSWMVLRVYEFKFHKQYRFNIDSILNWQINLAQTENSTTKLLSKKIRSQSSGKVVGYFDFTTENTNELDYSRFLVFYQEKNIGVVELHHRGNGKAFLKVFNSITASLDY